MSTNSYNNRRGNRCHVIVKVGHPGLCSESRHRSLERSHRIRQHAASGSGAAGIQPFRCSHPELSVSQQNQLARRPIGASTVGAELEISTETAVEEELRGTRRACEAGEGREWSALFGAPTEK